MTLFEETSYKYDMNYIFSNTFTRFIRANVLYQSFTIY